MNEANQRPARRFMGIGLAAILVLATNVAHAEDKESANDSDTHVELGGYIQPGYVAARNSEFDQDDTEGFEFANARLTGAADRYVNEDIKTSFRFNFDLNQGNFSVRDVYGSLSYADDLVAVDVGQMKMPFGLALKQSEAYLQMPFSARTRQLSFGRDLGAQVRGTLNTKDVVFKWWGMVANGEGGFRQRRNLDDEYVFAGRVELAPLGPMSKSEADLKGGDFRIAVGANLGWTPSLNNALGLADVGAKEHRYGGDVRLHWEGLSVRAELLLGDRGKNEADDGFWRYGGYLQAGYVLPWTYQTIQWEPAIRIEQMDLNRDLDGLVGADYTIEQTAARTYEASINTYLADHEAKVHLTYRRTDLQEGPIVDRDGGPLIDDRLLIFAQVGWL